MKSSKVINNYVLPTLASMMVLTLYVPALGNAHKDRQQLQVRWSMPKPGLTLLHIVAQEALLTKGLTME